MVTRRVDWNALDRLVPDQFDKYWQHTLDFLKIAREFWPAFLAETNRIEPAARRDLLIDAEAERLTKQSGGPVIAAGSTGSMPSTAKFLLAVAKLPHGAVVLPGLDTDLDDDAWLSIGGIRDAKGAFTAPPASNHPQYAMHALLSRFGIKRSDVDVLGKPAQDGREVLASEAMRPWNATSEWHDRLKRPNIAAQISAGMHKLAVVEAPNPEMEALAIAVAMREARHLDKSVALVTPDRALARRVIAALGRWNLEFNDSGGDALIETPAGIFARLAAEAAANGLDPPTLLALIKHPMFRLGGSHDALNRDIEVLELSLLRGTRPQAGSGGLVADFARFRDELRKLRGGEISSLHHAEPRTRLRDHELDGAQSLIAALRKALAPLEGFSGSRAHDFAELAQRHRETLVNLSRRRARCRGGIRGAGRARAGVGVRRSARPAGKERPDGRGRRLSRGVPGGLCRPPGAAAGTARRPTPHLRPIGSAADGIRPRHPGRTGRNRVAAGTARRPLAEPADAP